MLGKVTTSYRYCIQLVHLVKVSKSECICKRFVHVELKCEIHCFKYCLSFDFKWFKVYFDPPPPTKMLQLCYTSTCTIYMYACWWSFLLCRSVNNWMFLPTSCARVSMSQRTYACIVSQASNTVNFEQLVHLLIKTKWWFSVNLLCLVHLSEEALGVVQHHDGVS